MLLLKFLGHATRREEKIPTKHETVFEFNFLQFLICNVRGQFASHFGEIAASLGHKIQKDRPKQFRLSDNKNGETTKTFKKNVISASGIAIPYAGGDFALENDAYNVEVGSDFSQKHPETNK